MAPVNLAAAPSSAAILPVATPDGRAPAATGFAAVLANVQANAGGPARGGLTADPSADEAAPAASAGGKGDAQLAAWLTLTRLAQQLTGTAMLNQPAGAAAQASSREADPAPSSSSASETAAATDTALSASVAVLPTLIAALPAPIALPLDGGPAAAAAEHPSGESSPSATDIGAIAAASLADAEATALASHTGIADAAGIVDAGAAFSSDIEPNVQAKSESAVEVPKGPVDPQSIKALLAELKSTPVPGMSNAASENLSAAGNSSEGPSALAAAVGQALRGQSGQPGQPGNGERRGRGDTNGERTGVDPLLDGKTKGASAGLARAIAARFQANEGEVPVSATVPSPTPGRAGGENVEAGRPASLKYDGTSAAAFLAMPTSTAAVAGTGRTAAVSAATPVSTISGEVASELHGQIVQGMRMQVTANGGDAQIRLRPEYLGDLAISLKIENGAVTARLAASSAEVRQWIEANEPLLRQSLAQQDLRLEKLVVAEEEPTSSNHEQEPAHEQAGHQPRPRRRRPENEATFEVVV